MHVAAAGGAALLVVATAAVLVNHRELVGIKRLQLCGVCGWEDGWCVNEGYTHKRVPDRPNAQSKTASLLVHLQKKGSAVSRQAGNEGVCVCCCMYT